jgi:hypothetical protein
MTNEVNFRLGVVAADILPPMCQVNLSYYSDRRPAVVVACHACKSFIRYKLFI